MEEEGEERGSEQIKREVRAGGAGRAAKRGKTGERRGGGGGEGAQEARGSREMSTVEEEGGGEGGRGSERQSDTVEREREREIRLCFYVFCKAER